MAVTGNKKQQEGKIQSGVSGYVDPKANGFNGTNQQANPYSGMVGVSANTAQHVGQAQQGYQQGANVTAAQQILQQLQDQKPGEYQSQYTGMLDNIMQQIQNPQEFKYEFNGDNVFKGYADLYNQYAKQGMQDAMGQAAALTGGYGNSYAQAVGQQQYQQNMLPLYDKGLELQQQAYQRYQDQQQNLKDQYSMLSDREQTDYNRYRDDYNDWQTQEQQAYERMQYAQQFDYQMYQNDLNYWTGLAQVENQAYQTEQQRQDALMQYKQQYAWEQCQMILANGHMPSDALLAAAGLSAADAAAMMAMMEPAGGSGGGPGGGPSSNPGKLTGPSFQQATNDVQLSIMQNNPNLPASTLNANLTGTVGEFVQNAINNLQNMPAHLANAITGNTGGSNTGKPNIGNVIGGSNALLNGQKKKTGK